MIAQQESAASAILVHYIHACFTPKLHNWPSLPNKYH